MKSIYAINYLLHYVISSIFKYLLTITGKWRMKHIYNKGIQQ